MQSGKSFILQTTVVETIVATGCYCSKDRMYRSDATMRKDGTLVYFFSKRRML
jgi:hypothetical protein